MYATHLQATPTGRRGVILMVVLALLTLFAIVGISFVYYADSEAKGSQLDREAQQIANAFDVDPEQLANHFLSQMLFEDTNVYSAFRGQGLSRIMYGYNDAVGSLNLAPFSGNGRLHAPSLKGQDDYYLINYTYFRADGTLRDPEHLGTRTDQQPAQVNPFFGANAPYTYSDINNMFLAAVKADGTMLLPSFHRPWTGFGTLDPSSPTSNWNSPDPLMKYRVLRPRPIDQLMLVFDPKSGQYVPEVWATAQPSPQAPPYPQGFPYGLPYNPVTNTYRTSFFPFPIDGGGDVKNLVGAPAWIDPLTGNQCNNDAIWMDAGFPSLIGPDGRRYKPIVAMTILDLDNRVNVNVHGNIRGTGFTHASNQSWGPWSVNLNQVLRAGDGNRVFLGNQSGPMIAGRYGPDFLTRVPTTTGSTPRYTSQVDLDENNQGIPTGSVNPIGFNNTCYPLFPPGYDNGSQLERTGHPMAFNLFRSFPGDRLFGLGGMEALLRYGDTGSSNLVTADLYRLCSNSFSDARTRRMVTTRSSDFDKAGVVPYLYQSATPYMIAPGSGSPYPQGGPMPYPLPPTPTAVTPPYEFGPDWRALSAAISRLDLNRPLPDYPPTDANGQINDPAGYQAALLARQLLAKDIFTRLLQVTTGVPYPIISAPAVINGNTYATPTIDVNSARWLAQLSVNIVDFIDNDDYMTPFFWNPANPADVVLGTEPARVLLTEAYAQYVNDPNDPGLKGNNKKATYYTVNVYAELYNSSLANPGANGTKPEDGRVLLSAGQGGPPIYQLVLTPKNVLIRANMGNVLGDPDNAPDPSTPTLPQAVTSFGAQFMINPATGAYAEPQGQSNQAGFYMIAPGAFPQGQKPTPPPPNPTLTSPQMTYTFFPLKPGAPAAPSLLLRRLACPGLPPNPAPGPTYNPYVTVDYIENIQMNKGIDIDTAGVVGPGTPIDQRYSSAKVQPFGAAPPVAGMTQLAGYTGQLSVGNKNQPQHTFLSHNALSVVNGQVLLTPPPNNQPFDWLVHLDRQPSSPLELLHVSGVRPHELTQEFKNPVAPAAMQPFNHRVPWFDEDLAAASGAASHRLYRFFDFVMTRSRAAGLQAASTLAATKVPLPNTPGVPAPVEITPATMSGLTDSGMPVGIQAGSVLVIQAPDPNNPGAYITQENVVVTAVTPTTFTANFFKQYNPDVNGNMGMNILLTTTGDRTPGRININTLWDLQPTVPATVPQWGAGLEVLAALCDPQQSNNFTAQDVQTLAQALRLSRNPGDGTIPAGLPSGKDVPFWGLSTGLYAPTDTQFAGFGINNTVFRAGPGTGGANGAQRLFETTTGGSTPYTRYQMFNKIFNNITTRSNVFAVWMTVGFFEVIQDSVTDPQGNAIPIRPMKLGAEIGSATNKQIRHRMFAIVDRTGVKTTVGAVTGPAASQVVSPYFGVTAPIATTGSQAVLVNAVANIVAPVPVGTPAAGLPVPSGAPQFPWMLQAGIQLVIDAGTSKQETVTVTQVSTNPPAISATFTKTHETGGTMTLYLVPGNPGPQPKFDIHDPLYQSTLLYFSIIQ